MVSAIGTHNQEAIKAVEIEYGLRCPICEREGCNLALHEAEETKKSALEKTAREQAAEVITKPDEEKYRLLGIGDRVRPWPMAQVLERITDGMAFLKYLRVKRIGEALFIPDKSGLTWEVHEGHWRLQRSHYPAIRCNDSLVIPTTKPPGMFLYCLAVSFFYKQFY